MKDNRGISLVELIVAVAVIGILTIPLFTTFVNSAQINQDANRTQNEAALAQSIIEQFKSSNLETLHIPSPTDTPDTTIFPTPDVNQNSTIYNALTDDEKKVADKNGTAYHSYTYTLKNQASGIGRKYDAVVTLNPISYSDINIAAKPSYNINMVEIPALPAVDVAKSAVISDQLGAYDANAVNNEYPIEQKMATLFGDENITNVNQLSADMKKEIHVTIDKVVGDDEIALITCELIYKNPIKYPSKEVSIIAYQNYYALKTGAGHAPTDEDIEGEMSVYLFWNQSPYIKNGETITVTNNTGTRVDVYLLREDDPSDNPTDLTDLTSIIIGGTSYSATNGNGRECSGNINFKTNVGKDAVSYDAIASTRCYEISVALYDEGTIDSLGAPEDISTIDPIFEMVSTKEGN